MDTFFELIGLPHLALEDNYALRNRFIYASFSLLIFVLLMYFWGLAKRKVGVRLQSTNGLMYLSLTYLLYFVIGMASVYNAQDTMLYVISGLISIGYLLSLPFLSLSTGPLDRIVEHPNWRNGAKIAGFAWVIIVTGLLNNYKGLATALDKALAIVALFLLGFFVTRYFLHRQMKPLAVLSVITFLICIALQLSPPDAMTQTGGKFVDLNTMVLGPGLFLSVMILAYTFSWINELNFREISTIWTSEGELPEQQAVSAPVARPTKASDQVKIWTEQLAKDELEKVIDSIIIHKRHRNENLELILNIASRNTRNNNNRLKDLIPYQEYQLNRNKVSHALLSVIEG